MEFIIRGGKPLSGTIAVRGAKNVALKALAAAVLFRAPITIENMPQIEDVSRMQELLQGIGAKIKELGGRKIRVDPVKIRSHTLKKDIAEQLRASIVLAGPLLARKKRVAFPHPGGCVIGKRPIDLFLGGWQSMGAKIAEYDGGYRIVIQRLRGADFTFRVVSVTGTETLMMTAALAEGKTILRNAACEPEIPALAEFLNDSGAQIRGAGTPTIRITGTGGRLLKAKKSFRIIPDRIEAGSFLILGAALGKDLTITECNPEHFSSLIAVLEDAGVSIRVRQKSILVSRPKALRPVDIKTREYPGFPTDLQPPYTVLMTQAAGQSMVFETVHDNRLQYIEDLNRMGANIVPCDPHRILISGKTPLRGREIESPDLRAGLAFVIAALIAKGKSIIKNIYQIDRGYETIEGRLQALGADIARSS